MGCTSSVDIYVQLLIDDRASFEESAYIQETLESSRFVFYVSGNVVIHDSRFNVPQHGRLAVSHLSSEEELSEYYGHGLDPTELTGDSFFFREPWQSPRGMGSCYVSLPWDANGVLYNDPTANSVFPASTSVELWPPGGSSVNVTDSYPRPDSSPRPDSEAGPGAATWDCTFASKRCPASAVIEAGWAGAYGQIVLIVVGALVAIASERWFSRLTRTPNQSRAHDTDHPRV
jgi:hypothetical protein